MQTAYTDLELEWDEDRGGPTDDERDPRNLISAPEGGELYKSTAKALPWLDCGDHDDGRKVIPSVHLEAMVRKAPVSKPEELRHHLFLTKTLSLHGFLEPALRLLCEESLTRRASPTRRGERTPRATPRDRGLSGRECGRLARARSPLRARRARCPRAA